MDVVQEVTLCKGLEWLQITLESSEERTVVTVTPGSAASSESSAASEPACQLTFDQSWLDNGFFHFLFALIALKLKEGYAIVGNFAAFNAQGSPPKRPQAYVQGNPKFEAVSPTPVEQDAHKQKSGMNIRHLIPYFYYPINEAARRLDICPTVLKKICRKHGLRRWPQRKLQSIERSLRKLYSSLNSSSKDEFSHNVPSIIARIQELESEKDALCFNERV